MGNRRISTVLARPLGVLLALVLVLVTVGAFAAARRLVDEQNLRLLDERAATVDSLLSSSVSNIVASLSVLGQIASSSDPASLATFTRIAKQQPPGSTAVGVARAHGSRWVWLAGTGEAVAGQAVPAEAQGTLARAQASRTFVASAQPGLPPQVLLALAVGPNVVVQKYLLATSGGPSAQEGNPLRGIEIAIYDAQGTLVLTSQRTPLTGTHVQRPLVVGADSWRIEVASTDRLVGSLTEQLPWMVLGGGLVVSLLLWIALTTISRRRMYAERLVAQRTSELEGARRFRENLLRLGPVIVSRTRMPDGRLTYVSPNVRTILGIDDDVLHDPVRRDELLHPDDRPRVAEAMTQVASGRSDQETLQARIRVAPGRERWVHEVIVPERDDRSGEVVGLIAYVHDITEQRQAAEQLQLAHREAQAANQAKSAFLSRMSHELRTPMNAVLGFAQLLERDDLGADEHESVQHILSAGRHLLGLIDEVLDFSRIEAGTMTLSPEPVLVADLVRASLDLVRMDSEARDVRLEDLVAPGEPAYARADQQRLKQILLNLLSNAIKYNVRGGSVTVSVVPSPEGRVLVTVADTGPGIPVERQHELFQPFHRLGAEFSGVEGTGIGLALSRQLAEAMGATLGVDSALGQGSTFWLELPATDGPEPPTPPEAAVAPPRQAPDRDRPYVLQIEDNPSNIRLLQRLVRDRDDLALLVAESGRRGLELARRHHPRLVLLDLHLPDLEGPQVLQLLKDHPETAGIPVVVVSADATRSHREQLLAEGALAYITKPYDVDELLRIIDAALVTP